MSDINDVMNELFVSKSSAPVKLTYREYLQKILDGEIKLRSAHKYLYDALLQDGESDGVPRYFKDKLYGADRQIKEFMSLLAAGAEGQDIRRRILLLVGPPGGAKSTFVFHLKRALESYSRKPEGRLYKIAGCPINEDPLRAVPLEDRPKLATLGIKIEQNLCPHCAYRWEHEWDQNLENIPIESFYITESKGSGIGVFAAGEPNTQDASHLIGSISLHGFQTYGSDSHPMAWSYDGALLRGNRGLAELIEMLKAKPELLHYLLVTAQERQVPVDRVGFIDVDLVLIAHTNYYEYNRFWKEARNEAIRDRVRVIEWSYVMKLRDEEKIYQMMLNKTHRHITPWTLTFAAGLSILSRLQERRDDKFPPMLSLKLWNTEWKENHYPVSTSDPLTATSYTRHDFDAMRALYPDDGKDGISPRIIVDWISAVLVESDHVNPISFSQKALASYKIGQHTWGLKDLESAIKLMLSEYHKYIDKLMQRAFVTSFESEADAYWRSYLDNASAILTNRQVKDPITGEWVNPDQKFLRRIEEAVGISEANARAFRMEILSLVGSLSSSGQKIAWNTDPRMANAIESLIMTNRMKAIHTTVTSIAPDEEQSRMLDQVVQYLVDKEGYTTQSARWLLDYFAHRMRLGLGE